MKIHSSVAGMESKYLYSIKAIPDNGIMHTICYFSTVEKAEEALDDRTSSISDICEWAYIIEVHNVKTLEGISVGKIDGGLPMYFPYA